MSADEIAPRSLRRSYRRSLRDPYPRSHRLEQIHSSQTRADATPLRADEISSRSLRRSYATPLRTVRQTRRHVIHPSVRARVRPKHDPILPNAERLAQIAVVPLGHPRALAAPVGKRGRRGEHLHAGARRSAALAAPACTPMRVAISGTQRHSSQ